MRENKTNKQKNKNQTNNLSSIIAASVSGACREKSANLSNRNKTAMKCHTQ